MQNYARKYHIPIDLIEFNFEFMNDDSFTEKPVNNKHFYCKKIKIQIFFV
jgi:hypothetical protein